MKRARAKMMEGEDIALDVEPQINDPPYEEPAFNIADEREKCVTGLWATFFALIICGIIATTLHVSGIMFRTPGPEPAFVVSNLTRDRAWIYEFFGEKKSFNESRDICDRRKAELIVFNSSEENSRFNDVVEARFKHYAHKLENNTFKQRGLQIWTGIGIQFKAQKQTQLVLHSGFPMIELPSDMQRFYTHSTIYRICKANDMERVRLYRKAMASKYGAIHYIVKDYTGQYVSELKEPGCFNIRVLLDGQKLYLPFVCKKRNSPM